MLKRSILCSLLAALAISVTGSAALATQYARTVKPFYFLEPPDIIRIEVIHLVSKDPARDIQHITGNHTIGPDGFITLGPHGRVYVSGLTIDECRDAIEFHLSKSFEHPQVAVDIWAYNSKAYYVIFKWSEHERTVKFPYTGNDKVSDFLENATLLPNESQRVWVERPVPKSDKPLRLLVDWTGIAIFGKPDTNYELLPGDRIVVQMSDPVMAPAGNRVVIQERRFRPFGGVLIRGFGASLSRWAKIPDSTVFVVPE